MSRPHGSTIAPVAAVPVLIAHGVLAEPCCRCGSGSPPWSRCRPRRREHVDEAPTDGHRPGRPAVLGRARREGDDGDSPCDRTPPPEQPGDHRRPLLADKVAAPEVLHIANSRRRLRRRSPRSGSRAVDFAKANAGHLFTGTDPQGSGSDHLRHQARLLDEDAADDRDEPAAGRPRRRDLRRPHPG